MIDTEQIVFVNENGVPTGEIGPKLESHTNDTKMHLAFSCYILRRSDDMFLMTQRALSKKVWPGVWTNSVCGHPAPNEPIEDAIHRRAVFELGIKKLEDITCLVPKYTYKTPPFKGIIEHEFCPIFVAYTLQEPQPNSTEVEAYCWTQWPDYITLLHFQPGKMSYWAKDQLKLIAPMQPFSSFTA